MKQIEKLSKRIVLDLTADDFQALQGGHASAEQARVRTYAHDTHVNTCFTKKCCRRRNDNMESGDSDESVL